MLCTDCSLTEGDEKLALGNIMVSLTHSHSHSHAHALSLTFYAG